MASVEWASAVTGPWQTNWAGLDAVTVDANGMIQVGVPMFYRVRGTPTFPGMTLIPAGLFTMGDTFTEGSSDELPLHTVYVSAFYMDRTEVTKASWDSVYQWATNHGYSFDHAGSAKATTHPVHSVNWYDMVKWCNARSQKEGRTPAYYTDAGLTLVYKTGQFAAYANWNAGYRLPTEAEWEKAARGGAGGKRFPWAVTNITHILANYNSSTAYAYDTSATRGYHPTFNDGVTPYTSPAGYFAANTNGYGLYDMAGNVWERCWDRYGAYSSGSQTNPPGPVTGSFRVVRGGGWSYNAFNCRTAIRNNGYTASDTGNYIGFRSVLPPDQ
ncbi:MAG TPA: formylglycine-generating enzyme family protein [Verrucomicrobiae bacterium]